MGEAEIMEAISNLSTKFDNRFDNIDERFNILDKRTDERFSEIKTTLGAMDKRLTDKIDHDDEVTVQVFQKLNENKKLVKSIENYVVNLSNDVDKIRDKVISRNPE